MSDTNERVIKFRRGKRFVNKATGKIITLKNKMGGNRHWVSHQEGSKKSHRIHEGTIMKFYEEVQ